jgi:multidrug efflux pump subunit AcrA (membrane-fusion protein)
MPVEVDVNNPDLALVPGMFATASLVLDAATSVLVAPLESVQRSGNTTQILVVDRDRHVTSRSVITGLEDGEQVEIKSGLSAGDLVIVGNHSQLKTGALVTPKVLAVAKASE